MPAPPTPTPTPIPVTASLLRPEEEEELVVAAAGAVVLGAVVVAEMEEDEVDGGAELSGAPEALERRGAATVEGAGVTPGTMSTTEAGPFAYVVNGPMEEGVSVTNQPPQHPSSTTHTASASRTYIPISQC